MSFITTNPREPALKSILASFDSHKPLIKRFDTKFMPTKSPLLWRMTHSHGSIKLEAQGKKGAVPGVLQQPDGLHVGGG